MGRRLFSFGIFLAALKAYRLASAILRTDAMKETRITLPELVLVAGTRAILGAGVGLLLSDLLTDEKRKAVGWSLFLVSALSTIPLAFEVLGVRVSESPRWSEEPASELAAAS
jgi:hypothetical protein